MIDGWESQWVSLDLSQIHNLHTLNTAERENTSTGFCLSYKFLFHIGEKKNPVSAIPAKSNLTPLALLDSNKTTGYL